MRATYSRRLGILVGIPIMMTAALTGLVWADAPASSPPAAKAPVSWVAPGPGRVREVQEALTVAGYDPGPIDGIMGPRTKAAVRKYIAVPPPQVPTAADRALEALRGSAPREAQ